MHEIRPGIVGLLLMITASTTLPAQAQTIESLVMPGDVVAGHADIETECNLCHIPFNRTEQRSLCLDCHELVADDIENGLGYHGKADDARTDECASCHTDHEGRSMDIVDLDEADFDHSLSDFELHGGHADVPCADCHLPGIKHRDAPWDCSSCHMEDMPHDDSPQSLCTDCHNESAWIEVKFNHDELTDYPLLGEHAEAACLDCHEVDSFSGQDDTCFACHATDDSHNGRSGNQCETCHNPTSWNDSSFDHARDTDFALVGRHDDLACADCHSDDPFSDRMDSACVGCHLDDDEHGGHNGPDCDVCHSNNAWAERKFDHSRDTDYDLEGAHADIECESCHIEPIFEIALTDECISCHVDDDVHEKSQGDTCGDCHNVRTWNDVQSFDHDLTRFPLLGEHDNIDCDDCHQTSVFVDTSSVCVDCHVDDDPHEDVFADNCEACHNPVAWDLWLFDHNAQTDFALLGAHVDVACADCHRSTLAAMQRIGGRCLDCHRSDDVHDGEFGADCGRCHNDSSFEEVSSLQ